MKTPESTVLLEVGFAEGLRWHNGELWFSDFLTRRVTSLSEEGVSRVRAYVPGQPSGLGWTPDDSLLVVSMIDQRLIRVDDDGELSVVADLATVVTGPANDMYVDDEGRAYISSPGFEAAYAKPLSGTSPRPTIAPTPLAFVAGSGQVSVVGDGLHSANGIVRTSAGTLVVAETMSNRLSEFDIDIDGGLSKRRVFAELDSLPDGIAIDSTDAVWVSLPRGQKFIRVSRGGRVLDEIATPGRHAIACALGGANGRTLFGATTRDIQVYGTGEASGQIETWSVDIPA